MPEPKDITILVVDDEPSLRKAMVFDFKKKGFNVLEASCGREAFEVVKNQKIDLVLTDVRMPDGDGVELLDRIKELNPEIPVVIFITGFADLSVEDAYHKGAEAVFSKPFDRKALMMAVIKATTAREELWGKRNSDRVDATFVDATFKVDLQFPELGTAVKGKVLNVGRGGIFVALQDHFPKIETKVKFCILFEKGIPQKIEGDGVVRWIRTQNSEEHLAGCGIEFEHLDDQFRKQLIELINSLKTKSFIPVS